MLTVLTVVVTDSSVGSERIPHEQRLYRDLLANYESAVRPVQNASSVVNIGFRITLNQIVDLVSLHCTKSSLSSPGSPFSGHTGVGYGTLEYLMAMLPTLRDLEDSQGLTCAIRVAVIMLNLQKCIGKCGSRSVNFCINNHPPLSISSC